jgi:hypothetical protein
MHHCSKGEGWNRCRPFSSKIVVYEPEASFVGGRVFHPATASKKNEITF